MIDYRIYTFLKLCEAMNYRKAAEALNITQPAVTQHIRFLEEQYQCKLFLYKGRRLYKTKAGNLLESYARSAVYNEQELRKNLSHPPKMSIRIGATRTIGDYVVGEQILSLAKRTDVALTFFVDNTENLLRLLDDAQLDFAIIEGNFDKMKYGHRLFREEPFLGICGEGHRFADREVSLSDVVKEKLICREKGSGTRAILEELLTANNYLLENVEDTVCISSFALIKQLVRQNGGISFVYEAVAKSDPDIRTFRILGTEIRHEFNYVFLKGTEAETLVDFLE